ncbi:accessory factor UbiK family protein [Pollutimonas harenae]|uniref:Ubiquinone biosynthesis accessory factor UbiK n=1 Tax=Pollutimonas harenae TaxID=657015 RepID=A0A853GYU2_9BURK|nr:accessory factor UbiK family protein [Pollutimonas harenae]NYT85896.1 accessory factor UbiK family protein [Pollutimonas harenae]TEA70949.1 accessory factor UbiK family protein [Pollutimonas harenae]
MVTRNDWFEDFQKNMSELIAKSPAADIERNVKAMMAQAFSRMDLVTREEFDVQVQLLERALARITALESRVQALEGRPDTPLQQGVSAPGTE